MSHLLPQAGMGAHNLPCQDAHQAQLVPEEGNQNDI